MTNQSDHKRISDHFRRSLQTYDDGAQVQREVGARLISSIGDYPEISFNQVLEIGCCTGSMTELLCRTYSVDHLWLNDLVAECCERTVSRVEGLVGTTHTAVGDIESQPIPEGFDLIVSSSTFQWLHDLDTFFGKISAALSASGFLVFSLFGPGTMQQVKELTGVGLCYTNGVDLQEMLQHNFTILDITTSRYTLFFQNPREVLRHIQLTGVGGVGAFRWTPGTLKKFEKEYRDLFEEQRGMPLDYVSTLVVAKKKARVLDDA